MEEVKHSESYEQDSIKDVNFARSVAQKATAVPGAQMNFKYEVLSVSPSLKLSEIMRIEDVQILAHCYLVQYSILGKLLLTFIILVGVGVLYLTFWIPLLLLEFLGIWGSTRLNKCVNVAYLVSLGISLALRLASIAYSLLLFDLNNECFEGKYYSFENSCGLYGKYVICAAFLAVFECFQISLVALLVSKLKNIAELKRNELSFVLISQKVPRFICKGKLRPWKVIH